LLSVAPWIGASLWVICACAAGTVFTFNALTWDWKPKTVQQQQGKELSTQNSNYAALTDDTSTEMPLTNGTNGHSTKPDGRVDWPVNINDSEKPLVKETWQPGVGGSINDESARMLKKSPVSLGVSNPPCLQTSLLALPWRIVPFVFGMFVLVQGMNKSGWIDLCADWLTDAIPSGAGAWPIFVSSFLLTTVTIVLCNLINNQPATILLTRVIISEKFLSLPHAVRQVGMFAVILGSNLGANFTLIGALAGIMFAKILAEKNLILSYVDFAKTGFKIMPFVTVAAAGFLWLEHLAI